MRSVTEQSWRVGLETGLRTGLKSGVEEQRWRADKAGEGIHRCFGIIVVVVVWVVSRINTTRGFVLSVLAEFVFSSWLSLFFRPG